MKGVIWKKLFGSLGFVLGLALCLLLNFGETKKANAVGENFIPINLYNPRHIYFDQTLKGTTTANQEFNFEAIGSFSKIIYDGSGNANWIGTNYLSHLKIETSTPIRFIRNNTYKFTLTFNIQIPTQAYYGLFGLDPTTPQNFAAVICPTTSGKHVILDCKVTNISEATPSGARGTNDSEITSDIKEYVYVMEIFGSWAVPNGQDAEDTNYLEWQTTPFLQWNSNYQIIKIRISNPRLLVGYEQSVAEQVYNEQKQQDEEDRNNVSSTSSDSETDGDSASEDAGTQTTSILGAVNTFISGLRNMQNSSGTCSIPNLNFGNGFVLRNIDFCQTPIPPQIMNLAGLGMIFIIVPLAITLVKRMLSLYNEILGR